MEEIYINISENLAVDEAGDLREQMNNLISEGKKNFILDFSKCLFIDSTGLGVLVSVYKRCKEFNGSFTLKNLNSEVMRVFKLTRLDSVFNIV